MKKNRLETAANRVANGLNIPKKKSLSGLYMSIFLLIAFGCGGFFAYQYLQFDKYASMVEDSIRASGATSVLGIQDTDSENESSDVEVGSTGDVVAEADSVDTVVDEIEDDRREDLKAQLSLDIPNETDNPNLVLEFTAPHEDGLEIQIDGDGFEKQVSPYTLPSLSIGKHELNFRFKDGNDAVNTFEHTLIVIPRAPVWSEDYNDKIFGNGTSISFEGTALPNARVVILVGSTLVSTVVDADSEGAWNVTINNELEDGEHTAVAFARKDGYASNFSEQVHFKVQASVSSVISKEPVDENTVFTIPFIEQYVTEENIYMVYGGFGAIAILLIILLSVIFRGGKKQDMSSIPVNFLTAPLTGESSIPLREKFARAGLAISSAASSEKSTEANVINVISETEGMPESSDRPEDKHIDIPEAAQTDIKESRSGKKEKKKSAQPKKEIVEESETKEIVQEEVNDAEPVIEVSTAKGKKSKIESAEVSENDDEDHEPESADTSKTEKPVVGKVYSKEEFLKNFKKEAEKKSADENAEMAESGVETKPAKKSSRTAASNSGKLLKISLTSSSR